MIARFLRWLDRRDMPMVDFWTRREAVTYGDPYGHETRSR